MGRRRPEKDAWIPSKVYRGKSAYEYRPISSTCIKLCPLDAPKHTVIRRHAIEYERFHTNKGSVTELVTAFFASSQFQKLSVQTRKDYEKYWEHLKKVFGKVDAKKLVPVDIRTYMDLKAKTSEVQANRHHSFLSKVFSWGYERGIVTSNPCKSVSKFKEKSRDRYVEDWEYEAVFNEANTQVQVAMEISYLCAARQGDVLALKKSDISDKGIYIAQGKTGKKQIKAWTHDLLKAIVLSKTIKTKEVSLYIVPTLSGDKYTSDGFRTMWHKAVVKAREKFKDKPDYKLDFTFHDLKAKGITDYEGDKLKFSGHKTASQVYVYDRKPELVESHKRRVKVSE